MLKVTIGLPLYQENQLCKGTAESLNKVLQYNKDPGRKFETVLNRAVGTSSLFGRNYCASTIFGTQNHSERTWQKLTYDYYLSIDGDMMFSLNSIMRLIDKFEQLKTEGKNPGVIGGAYGSRSILYPNKIMAGKFTIPGRTPEHLWVDYDEWNCIECDWCGTGFMLIDKSVFETLPYPWFRAPAVTDGDISTLITEDYSICMDVKVKLNKSIWIDCTNRIYHLPH